jgi:hypothetical protein
MSDPYLHSDEVIAQKISSIGKRKWIHIRVAWPEVIAASLPVAEIAAVDPAGEKIYDKVILCNDVTDSWVVSLGTEREPGMDGANPVDSGISLVPRN